MADQPALLVLQDGTAFRGHAFGGAARSSGEVVFATAMTGYQEMLTDPSFAGQVLVLTYPLAGNYGISRDDVESKRIQVRGLVVHEECSEPSHWDSEMTLHEYLASENIPGIAGVDTRSLTRKLRSGGVMMGAITTDETVEQALARLRSLPSYDETDFVREVSTDKAYDWADGKGKKHVVVVDSGVKFNIMRLLAQRGCRVTALPPDAPAEQILGPIAGRHPFLARARRPGLPRLPGGDGALADRQGAGAGHLPRPPGAGPRLRGRHVQAEVRPPRRQPPGEGRRHRPRPHHGPEPRLRRRPGRPVLGHRGRAGAPQRRHLRGAASTAASRRSPSSTIRRRRRGRWTTSTYSTASWR